MSTAPATSAEARAGDARRISVAQVLVYELRVRDAMSQPPITAAPADSLRTIQLLMKTHRISGVPITKDGALLGIISIEDIIKALDTGHIDEPAGQWMTGNVVTLLDHFSLMRAVAEFDRRGFGRFPVLDSHGQLVGIISRGDITNCLMHHLEKRAEEAVAHEAKLVAAATDDDKVVKPVILKSHVKSGDFDSAGRASQRIRQVLRARGIDPNARRRAAIVAYEAETNIIIHSVGGDITATIFPDKVLIEAVDDGPGIENLELAMREGFSTAGPLARRLGFGAGLGLPNMKRCSDKFEVVSQIGSGTRVQAEILLKKARATS
jgi:CBS domain-containing protein/anti-sigma regulatory factor (Ser/Thr protein kinase)